MPNCGKAPNWSRRLRTPTFREMRIMEILEERAEASGAELVKLAGSALGRNAACMHLAQMEFRGWIASSSDDSTCGSIKRIYCISEKGREVLSLTSKLQAVLNARIEKVNVDSTVELQEAAEASTG